MAKGRASAAGGMTVLVADDSEAIRTRLTSLIGHVLGVGRVVSVSNGAEVLRQLEAVRPGVALVDVHLGDGGGDLLRRIKREYPETLLVALMRYPVPQVSAAGRAHGADHGLDKTTELEAMVRIVAEEAVRRSGGVEFRTDVKSKPEEKKT